MNVSKYEKYGKKKPYDRNQRLVEMYRSVLSQYCLEDHYLSEHRVSFVNVKMNQGLTYIDVGVMSENIDKALEYLSKNKAEINRFCSGRLSHLKYMPKIRFHEDKGVEDILSFYSQNIYE